MTTVKIERASECKLAHIYGMNTGKVFMSCVLYTNRYVNVNEWMNALSILTVVIK
jgi:hypothetical protein